MYPMNLEFEQTGFDPCGAHCESCTLSFASSNKFSSSLKSSSSIPEDLLDIQQAGKVKSNHQVLQI